MVFLSIQCLALPAQVHGIVHQQSILDKYKKIAGGLVCETYTDTTNRPRQFLTGSWQFRFDDDSVGVQEQWYSPSHNKSEWQNIRVPGAWDLEHPEGMNKQTIGWYAKSFRPAFDSEFLKLCFQGVFRKATVWLNGEKIGAYQYPYLPFRFSITDKIKQGEQNLLVVRVDNRLTETSIPAATSRHDGRHGWWPYGGIIRPVYIEGSFATYTAQARISTTLSGYFSTKVFLENITGAGDSLTLEAMIQYKGEPVFTWSEQKIAAGRQGFMFTHHFQDVMFWTPAHPDHTYLFSLRLTNAQGASIWSGYEFAFKDFQAAKKGFRLNEAPVFLRGMNRHEDHPKHGPVFNKAAMENDIELLKDLHVNFVRPGHYPNDVRTLKAMEDAGIMIAEELPIYQLNKKQMKKDEVLFKAQQMLTHMILRDYNRPGIVMWSIANEVYHWTKPADDFIKFLELTVQRYNRSRPSMLARLTLPKTLEFFLKDQTAQHVDVIGVNDYYGWYRGRTKSSRSLLKKIHKNNPDKPIIISEYGAGAKQGKHLPNDEQPGEEANKRHSYSEEYQRYFHMQKLDQYLNLNFIHGVVPKAFADFRMQWRPKTGNPHPLKYRNLQGLLNDKKDQKLAFDFYKKRYQQLTKQEFENNKNE